MWLIDSSPLLAYPRVSSSLLESPRVSSRVLASPRGSSRLLAAPRGSTALFNFFDRRCPRNGIPQEERKNCNGPNKSHVFDGNGRVTFRDQICSLRIEGPQDNALNSKDHTQSPKPLGLCCLWALKPPGLGCLRLLFYEELFRAQRIEGPDSEQPISNLLRCSRGSS